MCLFINKKEVRTEAGLVVLLVLARLVEVVIGLDQIAGKRLALHQGILRTLFVLFSLFFDLDKFLELELFVELVKNSCHVILL